jgi:hypothetical protein
MEEEWIQKTCEQIAAFKPDVVITGGWRLAQRRPASMGCCVPIQLAAAPVPQPGLPVHLI